jgi:methyl-accepting chemotaxis protein
VVKTGRIGQAKSDKFIELALNGQSGTTVKTGSTGAREFVRYDPVAVSGLNWALMTTAATGEVFAAVDSLRNTILIVIGLVTLVVIGLALGITAVIVKPIKNTAVMLKDIAEGEGDLTRRLDGGHPGRNGRDGHLVQHLHGKTPGDYPSGLPPMPRPSTTPPPVCPPFPGR